MSVSFTWSDSWDRRICGVLGLWKDVSSAPVEEPADVGQSRSPGGRTSRQVMHMDKSCPHLTDDKKTSEIYIFKTCWPFLVSEIIILWEEMSQLANVHYQVVPMRTADALPPNNVTLCSPNCLFSKLSNIGMSEAQCSKVIPITLRAGGKLKEVEWNWTGATYNGGVRAFILFCTGVYWLTIRSKWSSKKHGAIPTIITQLDPC